MVNVEHRKSMNRFSLLLVSILCLLLGLSVGWYIGHTRAVAETKQMVREDLEKIRDHFHETEHQDEFAAALASRVFAALENGSMDKAKHALLTTIAIYYRAHGLDGNSNVIAAIERYASTNTAVSNAIYNKPE